MSEKGYKYKNIDFDSYIKKHPDLRFQMEKLRQASNKELNVMYRELVMDVEKANKFTNSVGSLANVFAEHSDADLVLFIAYQGFKKSTGMMAKDIFANSLFYALTGSINMQPSQGGSFAIALIDGNSGEILWTNVGSPLDLVFKELPNKANPKPNK